MVSNWPEADRLMMLWPPEKDKQIQPARSGLCKIFNYYSLVYHDETRSQFQHSVWLQMTHILFGLWHFESRDVFVKIIVINVGKDLV